MKLSVKTGGGTRAPMSPALRFATHLEAVAYLQFATVSGLSIANSKIVSVFVAGVLWFILMVLAYFLRTQDLHRIQSEPGQAQPSNPEVHHVL